MSEHALEIENLHFSYPEGQDVLHGIDLTIAPGERVGLIGPNGAGKTTLFLSICGVLKPDVGHVRIFDVPVQPGKFHQDVGLVFQYPDDQIFSPSVRDDVAFGPLNMGLPPDEVERRVEETLTNMGIQELGDRPPHHLSGGQKRMVAIAGIQVMQPRIIIYDEPSANLDIRARRRLIRHLQTSEETILISAHDLELIVEVCQRVFVLDGGNIVAVGPSKEIMSDAVLMEAHGLERPHSLTPHLVEHPSARASG